MYCFRIGTSLKGEKSANHAHKQDRIIAERLLKIFNDHPRPSYMGVPPGSHTG